MYSNLMNIQHSDNWYAYWCHLITFVVNMFDYINSQKTITVFSVFLHAEMLMLQLAEMQTAHKNDFPPMSHQFMWCCSYLLL